MELLQKRLKGQMELEDKAEIAALLKKQTNLHIRALTLGGEIYLQQDMMSECL